MSDDDLHRTLIDDGARWRARLPAGTAPSAVLAVPRPRRTAWWAAIAAAAIVAAVATGAVLITRHLTAPAASSTRPCEQQFRVASVGYRPVPTPSFQNLVVRLTYTGRSPCTISAYGPRADLLGADGQKIGTASHTTLELIRPDRLTMNRHDTVEFTVRWSPPCAARLPRVSVMQLRMAGLDAPPRHRVRVAVPDDYRPACDPQFVDQSRIGGFVGAAHVTRG